MINTSFLGMGEVKITYEVLYDILRKEKSRPELQKLSNSFIQDVTEYLQEKKGIIDHSKVRSDLFSITERSKTEQQIINIKKIIKELYDRREKKILTIALNKSRTKSNLIDTSALLDHEKEIFNQTVTILDAYRNKIIGNIFMNNEYSQIEQEEDITKESMNKKENIEQKNEIKLKEDKSEDKIENKIDNKSQELTENIKLNIEFLKSVQKFIGKDLEIYGPYIEGDKANIPKELAEVLISKGNAKLISA